MSKIHYTIYLSDCQKASSQALERALKSLSQIRSTSGPPANGSSQSGSHFNEPEILKTWSNEIENDLLYLGSYLSDLNTKIVELRKEVR